MRTAIGVGLVVVAAAIVLSGGSPSDPQTPPALPGMPAPLLGTAVLGSGGLTAAVDSYGDVVELRTGPAGRALVSVPAARQAAGSVAPASALVPHVKLGRWATLPMWRADSVRQSYLPGSNVLRTEARFGKTRVEITCAAHRGSLDCDSRAGRSAATSVVLGCGRHCRAAVHFDDPVARRAIHAATAADRRWIAGARPLGSRAPEWAKRMYRRSLLVLRALTDRHTGAVAAGARDNWAYVWPRDAGATAIALFAAGYHREARRVAHFLSALDLGAAARFRGNGTPVPGRAAEGDAAGWVLAADRATRRSAPASGITGPRDWRGLADYQEGTPGDYLANAVAATPPAEETAAGPPHPEGEIRRRFATRQGLVRRAGDPDSGLDAAAAWAVRPFPHPRLFPAVRESLRRLVDRSGPYGLTPSQRWPGDEPWSAPTAWSAWSLAALGERRPALRLLDDLRRAATPTGMLPERVSPLSGLPRSTTPLAWSHAFAILALRQLWPGRRQSESQ